MPICFLSGKTRSPTLFFDMSISVSKKSFTDNISYVRLKNAPHPCSPSFTPQQKCNTPTRRTSRCIATFPQHRKFSGAGRARPLPDFSLQYNPVSSRTGHYRLLQRCANTIRFQRSNARLHLLEFK